jgi:hypothetical protein
MLQPTRNIKFLRECCSYLPQRSERLQARPGKGAPVGPRSLFSCGGIKINPGPLGNLASICGSPTYDDDDDDNSNSILCYLCAESTATRPITDTAQCRYK